MNSLSEQLTNEAGIFSCGCFFLLLFTDALIIRRPESHTVPIGATTNFSCLAQGQNAFWKINNTALDDRRAIEFQKRGFVSHKNFNNSIHNLTMTVNALPVNNNTRITCLVYGPADHYTGILIVIGMIEFLFQEAKILPSNLKSLHLVWMMYIDGG